MKYSIDRIEEKIAICEDDNGNILKLTLDELPQNIHEGDIIERTENGFVNTNPPQKNGGVAKKYFQEKRQINNGLHPRKKMQPVQFFIVSRQCIRRFRLCNPCLDRL